MEEILDYITLKYYFRKNKTGVGDLVAVVVDFIDMDESIICADD